MPGSSGSPAIVLEEAGGFLCPTPISPRALDILLRTPFTVDDFQAFVDERRATIVAAIEDLLIKERLDLAPQLREIDARILAEMMHETNTFSPIPTPLEAFSMGTGRAGPVSGTAHVLARFAGTNTSLGGLIQAAQEAGAEITIPIAGGAPPSGRVADGAFETFAGAITEAVAGGCDAVLLALHGAMATESHDDGEGELLRRIRALAPEVPIAIALDFHTNMSRTMVENATVIAGYRTYPHVDMAETGLRAGRILVRALRGEVRPVMRMGKLAMLTHTLKQGQDVEPLKDVMARAVAAEAGGEALLCSLFGGFPMADIPHVGFTAIAVSDGNAAGAERLIARLLDMAWQRRADFVYEVEPA